MNYKALTPCGDDAIRVVTKEPRDRYAIAELLREQRDWTEVVVGRENVTVQFDPNRIYPEDATQKLQNVLDQDMLQASTADRVRTIKVQVNPQVSPDLADLAANNHCTEFQFLQRIKQSALHVDMLGFAPGFAYVAGVDPELCGTRLEHPRQLVKAGSVGFIRGFLGLYALDGPGGWPIIGRTDAILFDETARNPFLMKPGMRLECEWV